MSIEFDMIIVGGFSFLGFASSFSQEGEEVHILAPANSVTTVDDEGNPYPFDGTSASSPLVTGSLGGFKWLSGYYPTPEEAKILLKKTAIPTPYIYEEPRKNGVGLLNSYKLGMVGKRLSEICINDDDCFRQEIRNDEHYEFSKVEGLREDLMRAFPECFPIQEESFSEFIGCEEKDIMFKSLRRAVLLDPEATDLWEVLSCVYREAGFSLNSFALDIISISSLGSRDQMIDGIIPILRENPYVNSDVIEAIERIGGETEVQIFKSLFNARDFKVRMTVVDATLKMEEEERIKILEHLVSDEHISVRISVSRVAGNMGGEQGIKILELLVSDVSSDVRKAVANAVGEVGEQAVADKEGKVIQKAFQILELLVSDTELLM